MSDTPNPANDDREDERARLFCAIGNAVIDASAGSAGLIDGEALLEALASYAAELIAANPTAAERASDVELFARLVRDAVQARAGEPNLIVTEFVPAGSA